MTRGRRILRVARNLIADRNAPPLRALEEERDPERFLWRMLPHAARTFSLAIAVLPPALGNAIGVAYLCCRTLDTVEDLARDGAERERLFDAAIALARDGVVIAEPEAAWIQDQRDRAHLVLVRRSDLVAKLLAALPRDTRVRIATLVERMADGMRRAARARESSGCIDGEERTRYCQAVLALPLIFAEGEVRAAGGADPELTADRRDAALRVGELIQLANVCRDVEKDLRRGVAYDAQLLPWVASGSAPAEVVMGVRRRVLERVSSLAPAVAPYFVGLPSRRFSGARGASLVLLITTARFFQRINAALPEPVLRHVALPAGFVAAAICARGVLSRSAARHTVAATCAAFERAVAPRIVAATRLESSPR